MVGCATTLEVGKAATDFDIGASFVTGESDEAGETATCAAAFEPSLWLLPGCASESDSVDTGPVETGSDAGVSCERGCDGVNGASEVGVTDCDEVVSEEEGDVETGCVEAAGVVARGFDAGCGETVC
jgi:hypothetical protein